MAFFKFRFPGQAPVAAVEGASPASAESLEALRRRARHRLLGSVVLVFVAVVAFPLLFDAQPRPVPVDTPIVIPDRNATAPLASGVPVPESQAPAAPLLSAPPASASPGSPVPAHASLEPGKEEVLPSGSAAVSGKAEGSAARQDSPDETAPSRPEGKDGQDKARLATEAQKAQALLDGKGPAVERDRLVIQVGAFSDPDKVREVRRKLEQAGIKSYIQTIEGKDGKRTTRVRVGPFEARADADKAAAKIRELGLPASMITL